MAPVAQKRLLLYFMIQPDTQDGSTLKRCSDTLQVRLRPAVQTGHSFGLQVRFDGPQA